MQIVLPHKVKWNKAWIFILLLLFSTLSVSAQQAAGPQESVWSNPLALSMIAIIFVLLLVIALLGNVLLGIANWYLNNKKNESSTTIKTIAVILFFTPAYANAQNAAVTEPSISIGGLSAVTFYLLLTVIITEFIVILVMAWFVKRFLSKEKQVAATHAAAAIKPITSKAWWDKLNKFRPVEQEAAIDLGHNYDGIRELDNKLPPWWLYGFYVTIFFGVVYLWRYHVVETAPLSKQEYEISMKKADEQKAAYLSKAANKIDENSVVLLKEAPALEAGKAIFKQTCAACHGTEAQGNTVGPNLTDDYWIHGGSIKDVFKSIKYGWPEKGMQSWNETYSPIQIAQLSSYIKSVKGTNPPNAKEKQGELFKEELTATVKDTSVIVVKDTAAVKN